MLQQNELQTKISSWVLTKAFKFINLDNQILLILLVLHLNQALNNNEMISDNHTGIKVCINEVVAMKESHFFIVIQLKDQQINKSLKYRTQISSYTNRPAFTKNQFKFTLNDNKSTLKFGLMIAKSQLDSDVSNALVFGVCTFPINKKNLYEQNNQKYENTLNFINCGKDVGKFRVKVEVISGQRKNETEFDPLISRVLYDYECKDQLRLQSNIKILESKLQGLYGQLIQSKKQQQFFQKLYYDLERDERQLKDEIDNTERINSKIENRLNSLQNLENLQIEIEMLSQSEEGKKILIERLQYFQDRIFRESEQYEKLGMQYKNIKPIIDENLKKAEQHAKKLKGKQIQEFEIVNNDKILKSYDDLMYQFKVNEQTIKSLSKMSEKSDLTAHQAKLVLSQVNYEIKLTELGVKKKSKDSQIMRNIEKQIHNSEKRQQKLSEQEQMVYKIKLSALQAEIEQVRRKIKNQFKQ